MAKLSFSIFAFKAPVAIPPGPQNKEEINEMVNLVCMYYARLSSNNVTYKQAKSKDIELISDFFKLKRSTVKNYKDYYDALYENNGRKG